MVRQRQACSESQWAGWTHHPTPPVSRRREQSYAKGSSGEQHQNLVYPLLADLLQRPCPLPAPS